MEYKTFKTEAVIISQREHGERDKLFTVFTKKYGKIEILAKSIRRVKAKLKGGLQVLNYVYLEFIKGKNFNITTDVIIKDEFSSLKSSVRKFRLSLHVCTLLDRLVKGAERDERIWKLLLETLYKLKHAKDKLETSVYYFEWDLLSCLGFKPELYSCISCHEELKRGKFSFSVKDGGVLCQKCTEKYEAEKSRFSSKMEVTEGIKEISKNAIKVLRLIIMRNQKIFRRLKLTPELNKELDSLSRAFIRYVAED